MIGSIGTTRAARVVLTALVLFTASAAMAEVRLEPAAPAAGEPFRIVYEGVWRDSCIPTTPRLEVFDRTLIVTFKLLPGEGCAAVLSPWSAAFEGVRLSGSAYTLVSRVEDESLDPLFEDLTFQVSGPAGQIDVIGNSDAETGGRVVEITGAFACDTPDCPAPDVYFGEFRSPLVRREAENKLSAVVPPGEGLVDVTVTGAQPASKVSSFQYLSRDDWEALLVPIYTPLLVDGALGSRWRSDLTLLNQNGVPLMIGNDVRHVFRVCGSACPAERPFAPDVADSSFRIVWPQYLGAYSIALVHVRKEAVEHLAATLRTRDLSLNATSWGSEIPIVRESELRGSVTLVDVPRESRFRQRLRIYDPVFPAHPVVVEFYDEDGEHLATKEIELTWPEGSIGATNPAGSVRDGSYGFPLQPAFAEIDLGSVPELSRHLRLWVRVTARTGEKIWAFVSITHNVTQAASTVTPQ